MLTEDKARILQGPQRTHFNHASESARALPRNQTSRAVPHVDIRHDELLNLWRMPATIGWVIDYGHITQVRLLERWNGSDRSSHPVPTSPEVAEPATATLSRQLDHVGILGNLATGNGLHSALPNALCFNARKPLAHPGPMWPTTSILPYLYTANTKA